MQESSITMYNQNQTYSTDKLVESSDANVQTRDNSSCFGRVVNKIFNGKNICLLLAYPAASCIAFMLGTAITTGRDCKICTPTSVSGFQNNNETINSQEAEDLILASAVTTSIIASIEAFFIHIIINLYNS